MWPYAAVFLSALVFDAIPVIGPPPWAAMLFLLVKFHLNPWLVVPVGVAGSTLGRYLVSLYLPKFAHRFVKTSKEEDLKFLGRKLKQKLWQSWLFVFLYAITPLSDTLLFLAAGVAKVKPVHILPPFFAGKLITSAVMLSVGSYAVAEIRDILHGTIPVKGISSMILGLVFVAAFLVVDWRSLLERKKFRFTLRIWK